MQRFEVDGVQPSETTYLLRNRTSKVPGVIFQDVVVNSYKKMGYIWVQSCFMWLLSFTFVIMHQLSAFNGAGASDISPYMFLIGSSSGFLSSIFLLIKIMSKSSLLSEEDRNAMMAIGITSSTTHIEYSSLPLLRLLLFQVFSSAGFFCCTIITEVLFVVCVLFV